MAVGIVAMALARPARGGPGHRTHAPDEDAFTVAAEAVEEVEELPGNASPQHSTGRVWILGNLDEDAGWMIPELLGVPSVPVVRTESDREGFWSTLQSIAGHPAADGDDVVVISSSGEGVPPDELGACALRLRRQEGLRIESIGSVAAPRTHAVDVATAVRIELKNSGSVMAVPPPVVVLDETASPGAVRAPGTAALSGIARWVQTQTAGARAALVDQDPREASYYAQVVLDSPVHVVGPWEERRRRSSDPPEPPKVSDDSLRLKVSEGAYIPWPTYRASLASRWRFVAEQCGACGHLSFPSRGRCSGCGAEEGLRAVALPRRQLEVLASTVIHPGAQPTEFDAQVSGSGPYGVLIVELAPGVRATVQLSEPVAQALPPGSRVDTRLRRLYAMEGRWRYGRKAVPSA